MEKLEYSSGNYLVTDPEGMVGRYLLPMLSEHSVLSGPTLFHLAGTDEDADAEEQNVEATRRLLDWLETEGKMPGQILYLSSHRVYSPDAGEGVDESRMLSPLGEAGRTRALTEQLLGTWAADHGVMLTIVRASYTFGKGIDGEMRRLFDRVVAGRYVHIRGNDACMSAVTAYDVARTLVALTGHPGVYNVSDGRSHRWIDVAEAMSRNAGDCKRMPHLPAKWAKFIYNWFGALPIVELLLGPKAQEPVSRTLTLDNSRVVDATGIEYYDAMAVVARTEKEYPYEDA
ncbi:MAG: NAD-dependent epimerase/dehydratase family protein [Lepagella sp.]